MKTNIRFWLYLAHFFLEWEMFQIKVMDKNKTHILCSVTFARKSCRFEVIWKNIVEPDRSHVTRRMRFVCWTTNTHWAHVILTAFPLQHCLQERVSALRYTYIACLVSAYNRMHVQIVVSVFEAGGNLISLGWWVKFLHLHWYCRVSQCSLAVLRAWVYSVSAKRLTRLKASRTWQCPYDLMKQDVAC